MLHTSTSMLAEKGWSVGSRLTEAACSLMLTDDGTDVRPIHDELVTMHTIRIDYSEHALACKGGECAAINDLIRNECRLQATPEQQGNFARTVVTICAA